MTLVVSGVLAGCSTDDDPSPSTASASESASSSGSPSTSPTETGPLLAVTISGDQVLPNAEEIGIDTDQTLVISIESDRPGELHVHSKPEQLLEFPAGRSEQELTIQTPGLVDIEEHETGAVVAQLKAGG